MSWPLGPNWVTWPAPFVTPMALFGTPKIPGEKNTSSTMGTPPKLTAGTELAGVNTELNLPGVAGARNPKSAA
jgi:hypothetical protein